MSTSTVRFETPEERELTRLSADLTTLEAELGIRELELATLRNRLSAFERDYIRRVGSKYAELDEIEAALAEDLAAKNQDDGPAKERAAKARFRARQSRDEVGLDEQCTQVPEFDPSPELRALYRKLASKIHPDLSSGEADRLYRTEFLKTVNLAYGDQNEARLRDLAEQWELRPESVTGEDIGSQLVRCLRKIALVRGRIGAAERELDDLKSSELHLLFTNAEEFRRAGRDLIEEMAHAADRQIAHRRDEMRAGDLQK